MKSLRKWLAISLIFSIVSILILLAYTITPGQLSSLIQIHPAFLAGALIFQFCSWLVWGARMKVMAEAIGGRVPFRRSVEIVLSNLFAASITPGHAGGEVTRIQLLREFDLSAGDASAVVLGERMLDALFLGIAAPVGFLLLVQYVQLSPGYITLFGIAAVMFGLLFFILLYVMAKPKKVKSVVRRARWLFVKVRGPEKAERSLQKALQEIDVFHNSSKVYLREEKRALARGFFFTVLFWLLQFSIASLILVGLGSQPWILASFSAQPFLMMIAMIPLTPGNSGIAEVVTATIYSGFVDTSILGIFILAWRMVTYYLNIAVGGVVSIRILQDRATVDTAVERTVREV
ncbi:MAG: flippase-like domain-containing protein [Euryarchaeota archaeon]|nr:flippase-like domain-containing protein [Euryarchaeota archaeon]